MKDNVGKVLERDQKIENLENSSGNNGVMVGGKQVALYINCICLLLLHVCV